MDSASNAQIIKQIISGTPGFEHRYLPNYVDLASAVQTLKSAGYKIVLTQGVYDLFHVGHKRYLEEAKKHGDILIVGVDTDELTKKRKGPKRPFDKLEDRVEILSGLKAVDIVTTRGAKDHIYKLIKLVRPHVLVMSETTEDFTDRDRGNLLHYCGDIKVLPAKAGTSTTAKLRRLMIDGVSELGGKVNALINESLSGLDHENNGGVHTGRPQRASAVFPKGKAGRSIRIGKKHS